MKTKLVLLGIVACVVAPFAVQAAPDKPAQASPKARVVYIRAQFITGSHLPQVLVLENGRYVVPKSVTVYNRGQLERTGALSVGAELAQVDPAISSVGTGRR